MTATKTTDVIDVQKKIFCDWFNANYMVSIHFDGDKIVTPMFAARSQGRSVSLCANVAWAAWQEARQSVVIELPDFQKDCGMDNWPFYNDGLIAAAKKIESQGYRVEVKGE